MTQTEYQYNYYLKNKARISLERKATQRERKLRYRYKMTVEQYDKLLASQNGVCAVCKKPSNFTLHVDHDHKCCPSVMCCGKCVRGLLCKGCNRAISYIENDNWFSVISLYLSKYSTGFAD